MNRSVGVRLATTARRKLYQENWTNHEQVNNKPAMSWFDKEG